MRLLLLLLCLPVVVTSCGYKFVDESAEPTGTAPSYSFKRRRSSGGVAIAPYVPLHIYTVYSASVKTLSDIEHRDLSNYITRASIRLREMLKVRQADSFTIPSGTCGATEDMTVFGEYNFVLYINLDPCAGKESTLAHAGSCFWEQGKVDGDKIYYPFHPNYNNITGTTWYGRPLAGSMTVCEKSFKERNPRTDGDKWVSTIMHEASHALVFNSGLYKSFAKCTADTHCDPYHLDQLTFTPPPGALSFTIPGVVDKIERDWDTLTGSIKHGVHVLITPEVKRVVGEHFGCTASIEGAELENQGGQGTEFVHLEKRIFEHETMGGIRTEVNAFSKISLAFFKDSGWYDVDWSKADHMTFGKDKGCDFATKSCGAWGKSHADSYPFCKEKKRRCSEDHKAIETCNAYSYANGPIPAQYSYFQRDEPTPPYPPEMTDFCPHYMVSATKKPGETEARMSLCSVPDRSNDTMDLASLQIYSKTARCFELGSKVTFEEEMDDYSTKTSTLDPGHGCYEHKCEDKLLWIKTAKSKFYPCYSAGQEIHVERRLLKQKGDAKFTIKCPACATICGAPNCEQKTAPTGRIGDGPRQRKSLLDTMLGQVTGAAGTGLLTAVWWMIVSSLLVTL